jgi:putative ABC transport system permease protein
MSASLRDRPPVELQADDSGNGGAPARRAVVRWAWRLFRREWRQQLLVLALLTVAVAATTAGLGIAANTSSSLASSFGTADHLLTLSGTDAHLAADVAALQTAFGAVEVINHQKITVPGSAAAIDLRAQAPAGVYGHPMLRLDAGRYPSGPNEVAVTAAVAKTFNLHVGDTWHQDGHDWQVVGLVENPLDLLDRFALVAPGQANPPDHVTVLLQATAQQFAAATLPDGSDVEIRPTDQAASAAIGVLVLATIGLLFVGLLAMAGFTVMAQRRLRALGMLGAIGAGDQHVRLVLLTNGAVVGAVAAVAGTTVGLAGWLAFSPRLETIAEHRIDRFHLPWWAILVAVLLAVATAVTAAWWPARSAARIPIVAALSARPVRPRPAHRFAALGGLLLLAGLGLLVASHQDRPPLIITGIVATTLGMLLLAPVGIAGLGGLARGAPVALRLALRDLARYQARSGAALAAVGLAVGISAAIAISAAAAQAAAAVPTGGNLPTNQLIVWLSPEAVAGAVPQLTPTQLHNTQTRVDAIATALHAQSVLALDGALDPSVPDMQGGPANSTGGKPVAALGIPHHTVENGKPGTEFRGNESIPLFVATPAVLQRYGITPSDVNPTTDLLTSRSSLAGYQLIGTSGTQRRLPNWQPKAQTVSLPTYTSDPTTLLTTHALQSLGLTAVPVGWLIQTPQPLTATQVDHAQQVAVAAGLSIETRPTQASLSQLRTAATAAGVAVALGVLAMTVGLIRSETAHDLQTLTATGASSTTRRTLTGATAGALALLGALLGTTGAYLALIAWYHHNLHWLSYVPITNLAGILVGLPATATIAGWLLAGQEPPAITRQPLD